MARHRSARCCTCPRAWNSVKRRDGGRDLDRLWIDMVRGTGSKRHGRQHRAIQPADRAAGDAVLLRQHRARRARPGASLCRQQIGVRLSPGKSLGADRRGSRCQWLIDAEGFEVAHFGFNAVLRDYARLGRLLAHDGAWEGKQIIPAQWMIDATTVRAVRRLSVAGQGYADVRLWLSALAASGRAAPVRAVRRLWAAYLRRSGLEACHGSDRASTTNAEVWRLWSDVVEKFG